MDKVLFSSDSTEWETPQWLFDKYNKMYHFNTDVCASKHNAKCKHFYSKEDDGLSQHWIGNCWMNPPYGRNEAYRWVKKAYEARVVGATVLVALLPARTDTKWFHEFIYKQKGVEIEFLKGRLKFVGGKSSAPFPSMIVIFR